MSGVVGIEEYRARRARRAEVVGADAVNAAPVPTAEAWKRLEEAKRDADREREAARVAAVEAAKSRPVSELLAAASDAVGMKPAEIAEVVEADEGLVVRTFAAGPLLVVVPEDRPDAAGRSGVMVLPGTGAVGALPVYTYPPGELTPGPAVEVVDESDREFYLGVVLDKSWDAAVRSAAVEWLTERGIEVPRGVR